jgi:hypothetical protein
MTRREIVKNIKQIQGLCESDSPRMAAIRLESLAKEIEKYDKQVSLWDRLTSK